MRVLLFAAMAAMVAAECANGCSGHGDCGSDDQCTCYDGFMGGDCSLRVCPLAASFVDTPRGDLNHDGKIGYLPSAFPSLTGATSADVETGYSKVQWSRYMQFESWPTIAESGVGSPTFDTTGSVSTPDVLGASTNVVGGWKAQSGEAHFVSECAGKGTCDRTVGSCRCYEGYSGSACQRTTCPNDCSGRGLCRTLTDIATAGKPVFVESLAGTNVYTGFSRPYDYRLWDAQQGTACVCDPGYGGIDCSLRQCPMGNDPLTTTPQTCGGKKCQNEYQAFSVDGNQGKYSAVDGSVVSLPGTYRIVFTDFTGIKYTTDEFELTTWAPLTTNASGVATQTQNEMNVKIALEALPNNVTGQVVVTTDATYQGGPAEKNQYRLGVYFATKSGNIPDMQVIWDGVSNAATKRSYVFQPGSPVTKFYYPAVVTAADPLFASIVVYPVDQTLYGLNRYWLGVQSSTGQSARSGTLTESSAAHTTALAAAETAIASALNAIPAVVKDLGAPFAGDRNVIAESVTTIGGAQFIPVRVAMPSKQFGGNKIEYFFCANSDKTGMCKAGSSFGTTVSTTSTLQTDGSPAYAVSLGDVSDGNQEYVTCSNRGICDYSSGLCKCFSGYTSVACGTQSTLAK